jgi:hypothetical protein
MVCTLGTHERIYLPPHILSGGGRSRSWNGSATTVLGHHLVDHGGVDDFGSHFYERR